MVVVGGGGWVVCKVILVFRFGPRLGLKTEDLGQAEQKCHFYDLLCVMILQLIIENILYHYCIQSGMNMFLIANRFMIKMPD